MADRLFDLLEPTVRGLGYTLLGIDRGRGGGSQLLRLYIDHEHGITVEDCEKVSRQVSDVLDVESAIRGTYTLEVSSPGLDRPFFTLEQHLPFVGSGVELRLRELVHGRRRLAGTLEAVADDSLMVRVDGDVMTIPYSAVERSRLALDQDAIAAAGQRQPTTEQA